MEYLKASSNESSLKPFKLGEQSCQEACKWKSNLSFHTNTNVRLVSNELSWNFQLAMYLLRLGVIASLLADSLVSGFTTSAAVHVFTSQLKDLLGLKNLPRRKGPFKLILVSILRFLLLLLSYVWRRKTLPEVGEIYREKLKVVELIVNHTRPLLNQLNYLNHRQVVCTYFLPKRNM